MKQESFSAGELAAWVGQRVYFRLFERSTSGHIAVDNIVFPKK